MCTIDDIPDDLAAELTTLAQRRGISRAELIRRALAAYLDLIPAESKAGKDALEAAYGIWKDRNIDGVEYQRKLRDEW